MLRKNQPRVGHPIGSHLKMHKVSFVILLTSQLNLRLKGEN
jgi:hypothetical protein